MRAKPMSCEHIFKRLRGGTHIFLESPQLADTDDFPGVIAGSDDIDDYTSYADSSAGFQKLAATTAMTAAA